MKTTLTDRYLAAAAKQLPASTASDVTAELEALIIEAVNSHVEEGATVESAERAVLTDLGDPMRLAAQYSSRPLYLIGPAYYPLWVRFLKLLLAIVPVLTVLGVAIAQTLANAPVGEVIGQAIAIGLSAAIQVCFWVTLVFAVLERTGTKTGVEWNVDMLPEPSQNEHSRGDLIATFVFLALATVALVWDRFRGLVWGQDGQISVLNEGLWPWWIVGLFAIMALSAALAVALFRTGRWTNSLSAANTAVALLFASWFYTLVGRGELFNPEFIDRVFLANNVGDDALQILGVILNFGVGLLTVWSIAAGWVKANRTIQ